MQWVHPRFFLSSGSLQPKKIIIPKSNLRIFITEQLIKQKVTSRRTLFHLCIWSRIRSLGPGGILTSLRALQNRRRTEWDLIVRKTYNKNRVRWCNIYLAYQWVKAKWCLSTTLFWNSFHNFAGQGLTIVISFWHNAYLQQVVEKTSARAAWTQQEKLLTTMTYRCWKFTIQHQSKARCQQGRITGIFPILRPEKFLHIRILNQSSKLMDIKATIK